MRVVYLKTFYAYLATSRGLGAQAVSANCNVPSESSTSSIPLYQMLWNMRTRGSTRSRQALRDTKEQIHSFCCVQGTMQYETCDKVYHIIACTATLTPSYGRLCASRRVYSYRCFLKYANLQVEKTSTRSWTTGSNYARAIISRKSNRWLAASFGCGVAKCYSSTPMPPYIHTRVNDACVCLHPWFPRVTRIIELLDLSRRKKGGLED